MFEEERAEAGVREFNAVWTRSSIRDPRCRLET
jgi:hypothetical protein